MLKHIKADTFYRVMYKLAEGVATVTLTMTALALNYFFTVISLRLDDHAYTEFTCLPWLTILHCFFLELSLLGRLH